MPFLRYQQVMVQNAVLDVAALNIPQGTARAQIHVTTQPVRYTMDGATVPTVTVGMEFTVGNAPEWFDIEDLQRIQFISGAGANAFLNIHYWATRVGL